VAQSPPTRDAEAYQLTLQGYATLERVDRKGAQDALDFFQRAVAHDPNYARAYAGIAMAQLNKHRQTGDSQSQLALLEAAGQAAGHALQLDPSSAKAETVLGRLTALRYNMVEAEAHYRRAAQLDPGDALIKFSHAIVQAYVGHMREAIQTMRDAYALAPAIPSVVTLSGIVHSWAGRDAEALKYVDLAVALGVPRDNVDIGEIRGSAALRAGRYADYLRDGFLPEPGESTAELKPAVELSRLVLAAVAVPGKRAVPSRRHPDDGRRNSLWLLRTACLCHSRRARCGLRPGKPVYGRGASRTGRW
jgi:tetratricopeptide (TPR) repeat protein